MKIFSILFTVLFFLGFSSVTYASWWPWSEEEYTVTNNAKQASVYIYLARVRKWGHGQPYHDVDYTAEPGTCLYVNEDDFYRLTIFLVPTNTSRASRKLCSPEHDTCRGANNYEIIYDHHPGPRSPSPPAYPVKVVAKPNTNSNCIDIEEWMKIKEQEQGF